MSDIFGSLLGIAAGNSLSAAQMQSNQYQSNAYNQPSPKEVFEQQIAYQRAIKASKQANEPNPPSLLLLLEH